MNIGLKVIGPGNTPYVVAEIGSNWATFEDCMTSISQAQKCGADAVKFQLFTTDELYGDGSKTVSGQSPYLDPAWLPLLKEKADAVGIEFLCSAFSVEGIEAVNPFVSAHKVASSEMTHVRLLEKLKAIGKPVLLSTAAQDQRDIGLALAALGDTPTVVMYCVGSYPANKGNPNAIASFKAAFPSKLVGFSDHSTEVYPAAMHANFGASSLVEKHVNFVEAESPDSAHSIHGADFKQFVDGVKNGAPAWTGPIADEKQFILRYKRRLIATRKIMAGEILKEGHNFGIFRSLHDDTHAFSPWLAPDMEGKPAAKDIEFQAGIGPGDV